MDNLKKIKEFWCKKANNFYVHIDLGEKKKGYIDLLKSQIDFNIFRDKVVIDFGCGGGILFDLIKDNCKQYIGYDISKKVIDFCKKKFEKYKNCEFIEINNFNFNFPKANIITCFSVIQHQPDIEIVNNMLKKFNESNAEFIFLNIRKSDNEIFEKNIYQNKESVRLAYQTNSNSIIEKLNNYKIEFESDIVKNNNYQFLIFSKKNIVVENVDSEKIEDFEISKTKNKKRKSKKNDISD